jgi:phenylacetate-CoA ligase/benzoylacetate-CoA ligase
LRGTSVERWQAGQIEAFVPALGQRSRMYSRLHAGAAAPRMRSLADLQTLPFTTKDDIRVAQDAATADAPFGENQGVAAADIVQVVSSSGTTGRPLYYALTARDVETFSDAIATVWFTAGIRRSDVVAHLVGLPMVAGGLPYADGFRRVGATLCWLGGFATERVLAEMRLLRVTALLATTSFALHLADRWVDAGRETGIASSLQKVLGGGEPGLNQAEIRARICRGLGLAHLRETMGLGDVLPSMWGECELQDGMHFCAQRSVAVELIDPATGATVAWREGASGEIVYTAFARDATPLVRYRSRDHALVTGVGCACGRTSPKIRCIGRTDDMLIYKGMNVFPTAVRDLVAERFGGVVQPFVRIWKERADQVRFDGAIAVDVEPVDALDDEQRQELGRAIEAEVRSRLQVRVAVGVVAPGSLPRGTLQELAGRRPAGAGKDKRCALSEPRSARAISGRRPSFAGRGRLPTSRASTSRSPSRAMRWPSVMSNRPPSTSSSSARRSRSAAGFYAAPWIAARLGLEGSPARTSRRRARRRSRASSPRRPRSSRPALPLARGHRRPHEQRPRPRPSAQPRAGGSPQSSTGCSTTSPPIRGPAVDARDRRGGRARGRR